MKERETVYTKAEYIELKKFEAEAKRANDKKPPKKRTPIVVLNKILNEC